MCIIYLICGNSRRNAHLSVTNSQNNSVEGASVLGNSIARMRNNEDTSGSTSYSEDIQDNCKNMKFVVYRCLTGTICGSWDDRQNGIISTFLLSQLMNRTFIILHSNPCDLTRYLIPNSYNWNRCSEYVLSLPKLRTWSLSIFDNSQEFKGLIRNADSLSFFPVEVIFIQTNQIWNTLILSHPQAPQNIPWANDKATHEVTKIVLAQLFKPNEFLENGIIQFMDKIPSQKKLICTHMRSGKHPLVRLDVKAGLSPRVVTILFNFLKTFDKLSQYVIYVATDSLDIKKNYTENFTHGVTIAIPVVNIDRFDDLTCSGFFTILLEQYVFSKCDLLLLTQSGYGEISAYMSDKPQDIFYFSHTKQEILKIRLDEIRHYREMDNGLTRFLLSI